MISEGTEKNVLVVGSNEAEIKLKNAENVD